MKHFFQPQGYEREINYRKDKQKHMESKQHASKKPIGQWRDQRVEEKIPQDK